MVGKIELYYDVVSPYSWYAFDYICKNRAALKDHGVDVEMHPVFLGGIMQKSQNQPPWKVAAKGRHGVFDGQRAQKYFNLHFETPPFFPMFSLLPMRCLTYIKKAYPNKLEAVSVECWTMCWKEHIDVGKPDAMAKCLARHFGQEQVKEILTAANSPQVKGALLDMTDRALESGAYGCPWWEVTNASGKKEPFFGSDRFHYMWQFLGIPWQDIAILPKSKM